MKKEKVLLSWSGGKDSAVSLFELKSPEFRLDGLVTTITREDRRINAHGIREELLEKQAESLELPLIKVEVPKHPANQVYEEALSQALKPSIKKGLAALAFGDLYLEDIKAYRDTLTEKMKLRAVYPVWNWKVEEVLRVFFGLGYKAVVTAVDKKKLPSTFVGRPFDREFVASLPSHIDPCGENGEFHTFVYDGPFFQKTVKFERGACFEEGDFAFQDFKLSG